MSKRASLHSQSVVSAESAIEAFDEKKEVKEREISISEIMGYQNPKWMAWVGFGASIAASFQLPMFGFILSKYVFALALPFDTPENLEVYR